MDRDRASLVHLPETYAGARIMEHAGDFVRDPLPAAGLDGILLASALHFVRDQPAIIRKAAASLKPDGRFLLVGQVRCRSRDRLGAVGEAVP